MGQFQGLEGGGVHVDQGLVLEVFPKGVRHSILGMGMGMGVQVGEIAKLEVNEVKKRSCKFGTGEMWMEMDGWLANDTRINRGSVDCRLEWEPYSSQTYEVWFQALLL